MLWNEKSVLQYLVKIFQKSKCTRKSKYLKKTKIKNEIKSNKMQ